MLLHSSIEFAGIFSYRIGRYRKWQGIFLKWNDGFCTAINFLLPGHRPLLLARAPRFRLDAEVLRDQALSLSGLLVSTAGGRGDR